VWEERAKVTIALDKTKPQNLDTHLHTQSHQTHTQTSAYYTTQISAYYTTHPQIPYAHTNTT